MSLINGAFDILIEHENKFDRSFSLIPSENQLSPMARLAFLSDGFSRYFFDEKEVFGRWSFQGGSIIGRLQTEFLVPMLKRIGQARHVNVHPVSGLTGMTLALAAFGGAGKRVFSVPVANGGHPDTAYVARKLGMEWHEIPFSDWATVDLGRLTRAVHELRPALVYVDHATHLFPLDLRSLVAAIRAAAVDQLHVHIDTSHVNGLIWGGLLANPLACGADSYGGSTHKTFPGPHKAVMFLDDNEAAERLLLTAVNMISHHHTASIAALAISLIEFVECEGVRYASQTVCNAQAFAVALCRCGFDVQGREGVFTENHQVWMRAPERFTPYEAAAALFDAGLIVNPYDPLPSLGGPGLRMGLNEPTRLGLREADVETLAGFFARVLLARESPAAVGSGVADFRRRFAPSYCFDASVVELQRARFLARGLTTGP